MAASQLKQVTVIGVGLLGGSVGLAVKSADESVRAVRVFGFSVDREGISEAEEDFIPERRVIL